MCGTSRPAMRSVPESARSAPVMILMSVDLPAPFSPTSAWTSPGRTSKDTPCRARTAPNDLVMARASSSGDTGAADSTILAANGVYNFAG